MNGSFTAEASALSAAVKYASRWLATKPIVPIHGGLLFEVDGDRLHVFGFGESATGRATIAIDAAGEPSGKFVVAGRLADALLSTFTKGTVTVEQEGSVVNIAASRSRVSLPAMPDQDYPLLPGAAPAVGAVHGGEFADAVRRVGVAAGRDITKTGLPGLCLAFDGAAEVVVLTATDKYRIARESVAFTPDEDADPEEPVGPMLPLASLLVDAAEAFSASQFVEIGVDKGVISFVSDTRSLVVTTLDFNGFPEIEPFFTKLTPDAFASVSVPDLSLPIKRADMLRNTTTNAIRLRLAEGCIQVSGSATERGDSDDEVDADYEGPDVELILRSDFLREMLSSAPGTTVELAFNAGTYKPVTASVEGTTWRHILMPLRAL